MVLPSGKIKAGTVIDPYFRDPADKYQEFVNAVQKKEGTGLGKQAICNKANEKWRKIKDDDKAIQAYIDSAPKPAVSYKQQRIGGYFAKKTTLKSIPTSEEKKRQNKQ